MAQAWSLWQQLLKQLHRLSRETFKVEIFKRLKMHRFRGPGGWLLGLTVVVAMLFWNWKLLLATLTGILVMSSVYLMQEWDWRVYLSNLHRFLNGSNRQLTLAVGSSGVAALSTYMAASIWVDSDSPWIAAGAILQGFGTLATILLLVWHIINRQASRDEAKLNGMLADLTDVDSLKRLIAVRQLTRWATDTRLDKAGQRQITDYLCLMLSREQETVVRDAVLDSLQALGDTRVASKETQPVQMPLSLKRSPVKIRRRS